MEIKFDLECVFNIKRCLLCTNDKFGEYSNDNEEVKAHNYK